MQLFFHELGFTHGTLKSLFSLTGNRAHHFYVRILPVTTSITRHPGNGTGELKQLQVRATPFCRHGTNTNPGMSRQDSLPLGNEWSPRVLVLESGRMRNARTMTS